MEIDEGRNPFYIYVPGLMFLTLWGFIGYKTGICSSSIEKQSFCEAIIYIQTNNILLAGLIAITAIGIGMFLQACWTLCIKIPIVKNFVNSEYDKTFYRELVRKREDKLPKYFSDRSAFWGNLLAGSIITMIGTFFTYYSGLLWVWLFISVLFSWCFYVSFKNKEYGTIRSMKEDQEDARHF